VAGSLAGGASAWLATGCFEQIDANDSSGHGAVGDAAIVSAGVETNWQLCQSPSCDQVSGAIPFLDQTPPIYLPDGATTQTPCDDVEQASLALRQTYCGACHQAPADQAGINFVLDDQQLVGAQSQTALTDAGTPQPLIVAGDPQHSWFYVRTLQGMGGAAGGMPPLAMPGYPAIPRPTASDLSVMYGWILACFPGTDGGAYVFGGGNYAPSSGTGTDADGGSTGASEPDAGVEGD